MDSVTLKNLDYPIASLSVEEIRKLSSDLSPSAGEIGCVIFPSSSDTRNVLVIFSGHGEQFSMLSVARYATCKVLYFQDPHVVWYRGSPILPPVLDLTKFIARETLGLRPLFFGQSSGGYAAIAAASQFQDGVAIACSPQNIIAPAIGIRVTPDDILDLRAVLESGYSTAEINVISALSEVENPVQSHFWMDHLHAGWIANLQNVRIFLTKAYNHSMVLRRAELFSRLLSNCIDLDRARRIDCISKLAANLSEPVKIDGEML